MKIKEAAAATVMVCLLMGLSAPESLAEGSRKAVVRSPGKQRAPVNVTITTELESTGVGQAVPLVVEATPTQDTESLYLLVRLPEGVQLLSGQAEWGPEYVPAGETRRLELQVVVLQPGSYTVPAFASVRMGGNDRIGLAAMKIETPGAPSAAPPMLRQKMPGQPGYDTRYKTVVGTVIEE